MPANDFDFPVASGTPAKKISRSIWIATASLVFVFSIGCCGLIGIFAWNKAKQPESKAAKKPDDLNEHIVTPGKPTTIDGIEIQIVELAELKQGLPQVFGHEHEFAITIGITNNTKTEVVRFQSWWYTRGITVTDEFGNVYRATLTTDGIWGRPVAEVKRIDPGHGNAEMILFEVPQATSKQIMVFLDGKNVNRPGHTIACVIRRDQFTVHEQCYDFTKAKKMKP